MTSPLAREQDLLDALSVFRFDLAEPHKLQPSTCPLALSQLRVPQGRRHILVAVVGHPERIDVFPLASNLGHLYLLLLWLPVSCVVYGDVLLLLQGTGLLSDLLAAHLRGHILCRSVLLNLSGHLRYLSRKQEVTTVLAL